MCTAFVIFFADTVVHPFPAGDKFCSKNLSGKSTIRVSNGMDPDQEQCSVNPDLGPNCLQKLSTDNKSQCYM